MASPTPLLARRKEEGYCLCLSLFEERGNVVMAILIPLPQRRWEGGYDLCPSDPEEWRSVVKATPHPSSQRKEEKDTMVSALLFLRKGVWSWSSSYHFQEKGGKVTVTSPILLLRSGGAVVMATPKSLLEEGGKEAMTSALLFLGSG